MEKPTNEMMPLSEVLETLDMTRWKLFKNPELYPPMFRCGNERANWYSLRSDVQAYIESRGDFRFADQWAIYKQARQGFEAEMRKKIEAKAKADVEREFSKIAAVA